MQRIKLTNKQKINLSIMLKALFPEFKYINIEKDGNIRFSGLKKNSIKNGIATLLNIERTIKIPLFELLITQFPQRLSMLKSGNKSFAAIYLVHSMYLITIDKNGIIDYFAGIYNSIERPYRMKDLVNEAIEEARNYEELGFDPEYEFRTLKDKLEANNVGMKTSHRSFKRISIRESRKYDN